MGKILNKMVDDWLLKERQITDELDKPSLDFPKWEQKMIKHTDVLRKAYYDDTKDINSEKDCYSSSAEKILKLVGRKFLR